MPSRLAPHKPGLMPARILGAEILNLGTAALATGILADLPFIGPVLSRATYLGPERDPFATINAGHSICITLTGEDIVLIASAFGGFWKYCFAALGPVPCRGTVSLSDLIILAAAAIIDIGALGIDPISDQSGCGAGGRGLGGGGLSLQPPGIALDGICNNGGRRGDP